MTTKTRPCRACGWRPAAREYRDRYAEDRDLRDPIRLAALVGRRPDIAQTATPGARYAAAIRENA